MLLPGRVYRAPFPRHLLLADAQENTAKVLHHLTRDELLRSLLRQAEILTPDGIALHTFWHGEKEETHHGLRFMFYRVSELEVMIPTEFHILETSLYEEMEENDSIRLVIKRRR